jgi:CRISPR-associated protein Csy2
MINYIVIERIAVQNANCIAGFTYGFPAITHFLGFVHALSRKLNMEFTGCAVISHQHQIHVYRPKKGAEWVFAQTRNPTAYEYQKTRSLGKAPPIIEEGKINMTVSLIIENNSIIENGKDGREQFKHELEKLCYQHRLAAGSIQHINSIELYSANTEEENKKVHRLIKRKLLPGFILIDRSELLAEHFKQLKTEDENAQLIDAWLDFSALKFKAEAILEKNNKDVTEKTKAKWHYVPKPALGWLVPIMNGYKAISELYPAGKVKNVRDSSVPFCFVEAVHSVGEWKSLHRVIDFSETIWQYSYESDWYLCKQNSTKQSVIKQEAIIFTENTDDFLATL